MKKKENRCEKCPIRKMATELIHEICEIKKEIEDELVARHYYELLTEEKEKFERMLKEGKTVDCEECPIRMVSNVFLQSLRGLRRMIENTGTTIGYYELLREEKERLEKMLKAGEERYRAWFDKVKKERGY